MTRKEKYPDTEAFHFYNANPKGRITSDCVIRALCTALEMDYFKVLDELVELSKQTGLDIHEPNLYDKFLYNHGWIKHKQPRHDDNTKYTGIEFCKEILRYDSRIDSGVDKYHIVAHIGGHHIVAIIRGAVYDIWDSSEGCIGNYWAKANDESL